MEVFLSEIGKNWMREVMNDCSELRLWTFGAWQTSYRQVLCLDCISMIKLDDLLVSLMLWLMVVGTVHNYYKLKNKSIWRVEWLSATRIHLNKYDLKSYFNMCPIVFCHSICYFVMCFTSVVSQGGHTRAIRYHDTFKTMHLLQPHSDW